MINLFDHPCARQHADTFCWMIVDFCVPNLIDPQLLGHLTKRLAEYYSEQLLVAEVII
jgi:protein-tyrosine phosphatase